MAWTTPETFTAGQTLSAASMNAISGNLTAVNTYPALLDYVQDTGGSETATSVGSAADVFSTDLTWTADGSTAYLIEWYFPLVEGSTTAGQYATLHIVDGSGTSLGRVARLSRSNGTYVTSGTITGRLFYTPAAGSATLNLRWEVNASTVTWYGSTSYGVGDANGAVTMTVWGPLTV